MDAQLCHGFVKYHNEKPSLSSIQRELKKQTGLLANQVRIAHFPLSTMHGELVSPVQVREWYEERLGVAIRGANGECKQIVQYTLEEGVIVSALSRQYQGKVSSMLLTVNPVEPVKKEEWMRLRGGIDRCGYHIMPIIDKKRILIQDIAKDAHESDKSKYGEFMDTIDDKLGYLLS